MEGKRHEKVVIVISSYIIGFTTAFIGFGVTAIQTADVPLTSYIPQESNVEATAVTPIQKNVITSISFGTDGLYAVTPAGNILLSVNKKVQEASVIGATRNSGYYFEIVDAEASRDGKFAYFCEQLMESDTTCDPYVYDLQGDLLHKVKENGSPVNSTVKDHASSWDENGLLSLNGSNSTDAAKPWELQKVAVTTTATQGTDISDGDAAETSQVQ